MESDNFKKKFFLLILNFFCLKFCYLFLFLLIINFMFLFSVVMLYVILALSSMFRLVVSILIIFVFIVVFLGIVVVYCDSINFGGLLFLFRILMVRVVVEVKFGIFWKRSRFIIVCILSVFDYRYIL